jgi:hypothetical protein
MDEYFFKLVYSKTYFWKTQRICWVFTWFIYNNKVSHPQSPPWPCLAEGWAGVLRSQNGVRGVVYDLE